MLSFAYFARKRLFPTFRREIGAWPARSPRACPTFDSYAPKSRPQVLCVSPYAQTFFTPSAAAYVNIIEAPKTC